jgi:hypothetical protein
LVFLAVVLVWALNTELLAFLGECGSATVRPCGVVLFGWLAPPPWWCVVQRAVVGDPLLPPALV